MEFAFFKSPVSLEENPGIPIPTVQIWLLNLSNSPTSFFTVSIPDK